MGSGRRRPFTYKTLGVFVDMGRFQAVASTVGVKWRGFPAWFLARSYHIFQVPGANRKIRLMTDSTVGLLFGRDSAELGQIGHPPRLDEPERRDQSGGLPEIAASGEQGTGPAEGEDKKELETGSSTGAPAGDGSPAEAGKQAAGG